MKKRDWYEEYLLMKKYAGVLEVEVEDLAKENRRLKEQTLEYSDELLGEYLKKGDG